MTTLITLLLALALDALVGDPPNWLHPVALMGTFIRRASDHACDGGPVRRFSQGVILIVIGLGLFTLPVIVLNVFLQPYPWIGVPVNAVLLKSTFSLRRLLEVGRGVERALEAGDLPEARRRVSRRLVSRDTRALSAGHVASAAAESLAENLTDSFVAPLMAFVVGGGLSLHQHRRCHDRLSRRTVRVPGQVRGPDG